VKQQYLSRALEVSFSLAGGGGAGGEEIFVFSFPRNDFRSVTRSNFEILDS
jgi:hypothetical protein